MIKDHKTGESLQYAFIEFDNVSAALCCCLMLFVQEYMTIKIIIKFKGSGNSDQACHRKQIKHLFKLCQNDSKKRQYVLAVSSLCVSGHCKGDFILWSHCKTLIKDILCFQNFC